MHLSLHVPPYSEVLEVVCLTNYFKSVSAEEHIATSFRIFNSRATVYSY